MPSFLKTPMDLTIRTGTTARLECAAEGHPSPQIAWQKDGGTDFPAARERRMHVMPDDDVFFIAKVKTEDMGVYSCTAQNAAGSLSANATLTVLGESAIWLTEVFFVFFLSTGVISDNSLLQLAAHLCLLLITSSCLCVAAQPVLTNDDVKAKIPHGLVITRPCGIFKGDCLAHIRNQI